MSVTPSGTCCLQARPQLLDFMLSAAATMGLPDDALHDGALLMDRAMSSRLDVSADMALLEAFDNTFECVYFVSRGQRVHTAGYNGMVNMLKILLFILVMLQMFAVTLGLI